MKKLLDEQAAIIAELYGISSVRPNYALAA